MYLEYFGLNAFPFAQLPDREFYYVGNAQHQAIAMLATALSRSGSVCVLSGASGVGKTTLLRMLMHSLPGRMHVITIASPDTTPQELLSDVLRASGVMATSIEAIPDLLRKLQMMLERSITQGVITTVICDDAQELSDEVLEVIYRMSELKGDAGKMLNILLSGRDQFLDLLDQDEHTRLRDRVTIFTKLPKLKDREVSDYITFRLKQAGYVDSLFSRRALKLINRVSDGKPALINPIADMSLILACRHKREFVNVVTAQKAVYCVMYHKDSFKEVVREIGHQIFGRTLWLKLLTIVGAGACSVGAFVGAFYLMQQFHTPYILENALINDQALQEKYRAVTDYLFQGRTAEGRQLYFFNRAVNEACFRSDALATLFRLHGYALGDPEESVSPEVLRSASLQSLELHGSFDEAISYNTPVVIALMDDDLTPFYGILYRVADGLGQLILGNYMFAVRLDYLKEHYVSSYTILHPYIGDFSDLHSSRVDDRKAVENALRPFLNKYRERSLESAQREVSSAEDGLDNLNKHLSKLDEKIMNSVYKKLDMIDEKGHVSQDKEKQEQAEKAIAILHEKSVEYQNALKKREHLQEVLEQRKKAVSYIRSFSLKLDGGFEKAVALFLKEQHLKSFDEHAMALLTLNFAQGPRLINVVSMIPNELEDEKESKPSENK